MSLRSLAAGLNRTGLRAGALGLAGLLLAGCQFGGLNSLNMPGTKGHGKGSYSVWVQVPDVATLPQNSPVMVDDVTVGACRASTRCSARTERSMRPSSCRWIAT